MYAINILEGHNWVLPISNSQRPTLEEARKRAADFPVARIIDLDSLKTVEVTGTFAKDMKPGEKAVIVHDRFPHYNDGSSDMVGLTIKRNRDGTFVVLDFDLPQSFVPVPFTFTPYPGTILHNDNRYVVLISDDPQPFCPPGRWAERRKTEPKRHIPTEDEVCHCKECRAQEAERLSHLDDPPPQTDKVDDLHWSDRPEYRAPSSPKKLAHRTLAIAVATAIFAILVTILVCC